MTLQKVKTMLFKLPLNGILKEGLCYSEPIMTMNGNRIIDNFFVYAIDSDENVYSGPLGAFGIYADTREVAYIVEEPADIFKSDCRVTFPVVYRTEDLKKDYEVYEKAYPIIREALINNYCKEMDKDLIRRYIQSLKKIVYSGLWDFYKELGKTFFDWADEKLNEMG